MTVVSASAPGKIVVAGEYAVLGGAPAVSMAVDRRAWATVRSGGDGPHRLTTRGPLDGSWRFTCDAAAPDWIDLPPEAGAMSLFEAIVAECRPTATPGLDITLDSTAFHDPQSRQKLGFGSSAAVTVALIAALSPSAEGTRTSAAARRAHGRFQGGGSGVDIATAVSGGLVIYTRDDGAEAIDWPPDLEYAILWSGSEASTAERLRALEGGAGDGGEGQSELAGAAAAAARAWRRGAAQSILESMRHFLDKLTAFDRQGELGIFAAGHAGLVRLAGEFPGLVYKPCGAGGGDVGMALATDRQVLKRFTAEAARCGFTPLRVRLDERGVEVETAG